MAQLHNFPPTLFEKGTQFKLKITELEDSVQPLDYPQNPILMLYQAGYLTIDREEGKYYYLRHPNKEVEESFSQELKDYRDKLYQVTDISAKLIEGDFEYFEETISTFFAKQNPLKTNEAFFHSQLFNYLYCNKKEDEHSVIEWNLGSRRPDIVMIGKKKNKTNEVINIVIIIECSFFKTDVMTPDQLLALQTGFGPKGGKAANTSISKLKTRKYAKDVIAELKNMGNILLEPKYHIQYVGMDFDKRTLVHLSVHQSKELNKNEDISEEEEFEEIYPKLAN